MAQIAQGAHYGTMHAGGVAQTRGKNKRVAPLEETVDGRKHHSLMDRFEHQQRVGTEMHNAYMVNPGSMKSLRHPGNIVVISRDTKKQIALAQQGQSVGTTDRLG